MPFYSRFDRLLRTPQTSSPQGTYQRTSDRRCETVHVGELTTSLGTFHPPSGISLASANTTQPPQKCLPLQVGVTFELEGKVPPRKRQPGLAQEQSSSEAPRELMLSQFMGGGSMKRIEKRYAEKQARGVGAIRVDGQVAAVDELRSDVPRRGRSLNRGEVLELRGLFEGVDPRDASTALPPRASRGQQQAERLSLSTSNADCGDGESLQRELLDFSFPSRSTALSPRASRVPRQAELLAFQTSNGDCGDEESMQRELLDCSVLFRLKATVAKKCHTGWNSLRRHLHALR